MRGGRRDRTGWRWIEPGPAGADVARRTGRRPSREAVALVLVPIVGLAVGSSVALRTEPVHTATVGLMVQPLVGNPYRPGESGEQLVNLTTEARALASVDPVAGAHRSSGSPVDAGGPAGGLDVTVHADTQVLEVSSSSADAVTARTTAQAVAAAFLRQRRDRAAAIVDQEARGLDDQIAAVDLQLDQLAVARAGVPNRSADAVVMDQRAGALTQQLTSLAARRSDLATTNLDPGQVVTPVAVHAGGPLASPLVWPALGLALGLLADAGLLAVQRSRSHRVADAAALEASGVAVLADIGRGNGHGSDAADGHRRLRAALLARHRRRPLVVTLTHLADHTPTTPVDLAVAMARSGLDTVVLDATTAGCGPARVLAPFTASGLGDALVGDVTVADVTVADVTVADVTVAVAPLLAVVAPGARLAGLGDLLMSEAMRRVLRQVADAADVVVVAAGAAASGATHSLAGMADATVVEVGAGATTDDTLAGIASLRQAGAGVDGVVLLGPLARRPVDPFEPDTGIGLRQLGPAVTRALPPAPDRAGGQPAPV